MKFQVINFSRKKLIIPIVFLVCELSFSSARGGNLFRVTNVDRAIELSPQFVRVRETFSFRNAEEDTLGQYFVYTSLSNGTSLAYMTALGGPRLWTPLQHRRVMHDKDFLTYLVYLDRPLHYGEKDKMLIETVLRYPSTEDPKDGDGTTRRRVYVANKFILSPYKIAFQTTKVTAGDKEIEMSYMDVYPFSKAPLVLGIQSDMDFSSETKLTREVEDFLWGKIDVRDTVNLGPIGPVARKQWESEHTVYDFNAMQNISESCLDFPRHNFKTYLCGFIDF